MFESDPLQTRWSRPGARRTSNLYPSKFFSRCSKGNPCEVVTLVQPDWYLRGQFEFPSHTSYNHCGAAVAPLECARGVFGQLDLIFQLLTIAEVSNVFVRISTSLDERG